MMKCIPPISTVRAGYLKHKEIPLQKKTLLVNLRNLPVTVLRPDDQSTHKLNICWRSPLDLLIMVYCFNCVCQLFVNVFWFIYCLSLSISCIPVVNIHISRYWCRDSVPLRPSLQLARTPKPTRTWSRKNKLVSTLHSMTCSDCWIVKLVRKWSNPIWRCHRQKGC